MAPRKPLTLLITAGEASGDRLGAALMAALKARRKDIRFVGVGGEGMVAEGLECVFPMDDLAVMGLAEVVPAIPRILRRLKELAAFAETTKPDGIITIDSQEFSYRFAKAVRRRGLDVPIVLYTAPKIWAWRRGRLKKLRGIFDHILVKFPFEMPFFVNGGIPATYVGHPAVTTLAEIEPNGMRTALALALLPGSRKSELVRHWPLILATYRRLKANNPHLTGRLVLADEAALKLCQSLAPWNTHEGISAVVGEARFEALATCRAALAKSGTNNLEMALLGVPAVVCYRMNALTYWLAKWLVKVRYISLPNLILDEAVYPELIQNAATPEALAAALGPILQQKKPFGQQKTLLARLKAHMGTPKPPAEMAADVVLDICAGKTHNKTR